MFNTVLRTTLAVAAAACFVASPAMAALKKVTLLQPVPAIDIRNAPWAVAQEMGWLAEGGIDLDIQFTKGSVVLIQQIMSGNAQYGMPPPEPGLIALSKGGGLKFFFASTTKSPFPLVVLENSKVKDLKDLKGTTIGLHSMTAVQYFTTQSILRSVGLKMSEDFKFVEVGAGPAALKALQDGQISALATNVFNYAGFESRGAKFRYMSTPEVDPILAWGLVTTPSYLQANRQEAVNLARAFAKGNIFCRDNREECVRIFLKRFPTVRTPGISDEQTIADQARILDKFIEYAPKTPGKPWGWYEAAAWKAVVDYMVASGQLAQAIDPAPLYTNDLLEEINNFDAGNLRAAAAK
jgi:NitT/TauT family transport system substrate-binding protein